MRGNEGNGFVFLLISHIAHAQMLFHEANYFFYVKDITNS